MGKPSKAASIENIEIIILAAGLGTRMKSDLPKVLHRMCGYSMLQLLMEQLDGVVPAGCRFNIVVGHGKEQVIKAVQSLQASGQIKTPVTFTVQEEQLGTGHAVKLALDNSQSTSTLIAVFNGDLPLFTGGSFQAFLDEHIRTKSSASLASATLDDAGQYGRIVRKGKTFTGVVEYKDASVAQRRIREINGGVYIFSRSILEQALKKLRNRNVSGEFYLPDVFDYARKQKKKITAHHYEDSTVLMGVNNMKELAEAQAALYQRKAEQLMVDGVFIAEPLHTYVGPRVKVGRGCVIGPFTAINGNSVLGDRVRIGAHCELTDVTVGDDTLIRNATVAEKSVIGRSCAIGPMAHFRPGTVLKDSVRIGNFVEVKESVVGTHTNAAHLSYIGDAEIGSNVNLGCGFITCNFDGTEKEGRRKHRTKVGNNVFVGSDSQLIAPITIADGTYIASGSTVTESVSEEHSLVLARTRQVTKPGYAKKYKK